MNVRLGQRIQQLRTDSTHGASWLAKQAIETLVEGVQDGVDPLELGRELVAARPAVAGAVGRVLAAGRTPDQLADEAHALLAGRDRAACTIAVLLRDRLRNGVVMTHSASATAREAILYGEPPARVVCTVSEPVGEGRWLADELAAAGIPVELVDDDDGPAAAATSSILLFGANSVFPDGSFVNKVHTARLAAAARAAGVPVLVACETIKLLPVVTTDPAEDRFELVPAELVDRYATEEGLFAPDEIASLVDRTPLLVEGYELLADPVG